MPWSSRPATRPTSAIISTIAGKEDYIVLDIDSHASIYDGCALGNAQIVPFRHNDIEALEKRLKRIPEGAGKLVVLEGVYSMLGDIAPLKEMVAVSKANGAMVLVDEAHSMGFIGEHGRGVAEAQGVIDDVDFIIGTFSKSVGTVGGFCVSNHPKFEILRLDFYPGLRVYPCCHAGNCPFWAISTHCSSTCCDEAFQESSCSPSSLLPVPYPDNVPIFLTRDP